MRKEKQKPLLCSDRDRNVTVAHLEHQLAKGKLTEDEFDARAAMALCARTNDELTAAAADIAPPPVRMTLIARVKDAASTPAYFSGWLAISLMTTVIWGLSSIHHGSAHWFWPSFVIVPWAVLLSVRTLTGTLRPPPRWYYGSKPYDWL